LAEKELANENFEAVVENFEKVIEISDKLGDKEKAQQFRDIVNDFKRKLGMEVDEDEQEIAAKVQGFLEGLMKSPGAAKTAKIQAVPIEDQSIIEDGELILSQFKELQREGDTIFVDENTPEVPFETTQVPPQIPSPPSQVPPQVPSPPSQVPPQVPSPPSQVPPQVPPPPSQVPPQVPSPPSQVPPQVPPPPSQVPPQVPPPPSQVPPQVPSPPSQVPPQVPSPPSQVPPQVPSPPSQSPPSPPQVSPTPQFPHPKIPTPPSPSISQELHSSTSAESISSQEDQTGTIDIIKESEEIFKRLKKLQGLVSEESTSEIKISPVEEITKQAQSDTSIPKPEFFSPQNTTQEIQSSQTIDVINPSVIPQDTNNFFKPPNSIQESTDQLTTEGQLFTPPDTSMADISSQISDESDVSTGISGLFVPPKQAESSINIPSQKEPISNHQISSGLETKQTAVNKPVFTPPKVEEAEPEIVSHLHDSQYPEDYVGDRPRTFVGQQETPSFFIPQESDINSKINDKTQIEQNIPTTQPVKPVLFQPPEAQEEEVPAVEPSIPSAQPVKPVLFQPPEAQEEEVPAVGPSIPSAQPVKPVLFQPPEAQEEEVPAVEQKESIHTTLDTQISGVPQFTPQAPEIVSFEPNQQESRLPESEVATPMEEITNVEVPKISIEKETQDLRQTILQMRGEIEQRESLIEMEIPKSVESIPIEKIKVEEISLSESKKEKPKDEREELIEMIKRELPKIPKKKIKFIVNELLKRPKGKLRDTWFKVYVHKNKQYK